MRGCVRLRSSRKTIQPRATGTPQCLGLRPLRARSQPRFTPQRLQNVENRGEPCGTCEAAYGCAAVAKHSTECDGYTAVLGLTTASRSIAASCYSSATTQRGEPCSRCRACEAAYGCAAVVKPFNRVQRVRRSAWVDDRFALDRSLVLLVSDYKTCRTRGEPCSRCRACEAAYGCAAVAKHSTACDGYAAVLGLTTASRSIAASCYSSATT